MQIVVKNLSYTYSEKSKALAVQALKGVSLTVNEGEFLGIVGHTGSGKSTFIQHLNGLIKVGKSCEELRVGDYNLTDKKCDLLGLRSKVGMVFQYPEYQLFAETVFEDVAFGLKNFFPSLSKEEVEKRVEEALTVVGLDYQAVKDKSPFELSGGQKRRVAIAGVIVSKPEVLVLDEPVAGLDPAGKRDFLRLLHSLHSSFVKTIIIVSHDMNAVAENCSRVVVFCKGELVKEGTPQDVFDDARLEGEWGLELPLTERLKKALKAVGVAVDGDLTVDGFIDAYARAKGLNNGAEKGAKECQCGQAGDGGDGK